MSDTLRRYNRGEIVTSRDWTANDDAVNDAWVLHNDLQRDKATGQFGLFDGEVYYKKVNPFIELTPEQEHLLRPSQPEKKESLTIHAPKYNVLSEEGKLQVVRNGLKEEIEKERQIKELKKAIQAEKTRRRKVQ